MRPTLRLRLILLCGGSVFLGAALMRLATASESVGVRLGLLLVGVAFLTWAVRWISRKVSSPLALATEQLREMAGETAGGALAPADVPGQIVELIRQLELRLQTERAEALEREKRLQQGAELRSTVLEAMVEGVIVVDAEQRIVFANPSAQPVLRRDRNSVEKKPIWELVRSPQLSQLLSDVVRSREIRSAEIELGRDKRVLDVTAHPVSGEPLEGAVLVLHDVTELRRLENLRREFVSNVSHELKTPLTSIHAYADTLLNEPDDSEMRQVFLGRILEQADRLHALILDLLNLAKIESGGHAFEIAPVAVAPIADACLEAHAALAHSKNIRLVREGVSEMTVTADADGLRTIFDNLVKNAVHYTPDGGRVTVRLVPGDGQGLIECMDTGIGISREHQGRIFERFFRADKARSRAVGGTGLGLAIVKNLAQRFGGHVEVESEMGRGSTFRVTLPLAEDLAATK